MRVGGHKLVSEFPGEGNAECECGARSQDLPGIEPRRKWHRAHKAHVRETRETGVRKLRPHEPIPTTEPRRYLNPAGYIRLRWKLAPGLYVEELEHRVVMGRPAGKEVHHIDEVKTNNAPENLIALTRQQHGAVHAKYSDAEWHEIGRAYERGMSMPRLAKLYGIDSSAISRQLAKRGYKRASMSRYTTHCAKGHEFTPENTLRTSQQRRCRTCRAEYESRPRSKALSKERVQRFYERKRQAQANSTS